MDGETGAELCAAAAGSAQKNITNTAIGKHKLTKVIARLIGFFLYGMKVRGNVTIFCLVAWEESGNANLPIGGLRNANREIGIPGTDDRQIYTWLAASCSNA